MHRIRCRRKLPPSDLCVGSTVRKVTAVGSVCWICCRKSFRRRICGSDPLLGKVATMGLVHRIHRQKSSHHRISASDPPSRKLPPSDQCVGSAVEKVVAVGSAIGKVLAIGSVHRIHYRERMPPTNRVGNCPIVDGWPKLRRSGERSGSNRGKQNIRARLDCPGPRHRF